MAGARNRPLLVACLTKLIEQVEFKTSRGIMPGPRHKRRVPTIYFAQLADNPNASSFQDWLRGVEQTLKGHRLTYQIGMYERLKLDPQTEIPLPLYSNSTYDPNDWNCFEFKQQAVWLAHWCGRDFSDEVPGVTDPNQFTNDELKKCFQAIDEEQGWLASAIRQSMPKEPHDFQSETLKTHANLSKYPLSGILYLRQLHTYFYPSADSSIQGLKRRLNSCAMGQTKYCPLSEEVEVEAMSSHTEPLKMAIRTINDIHIQLVAYGLTRKEIDDNFLSNFVRRLSKVPEGEPDRHVILHHCVEWSRKLNTGATLSWVEVKTSLEQLVRLRGGGTKSGTSKSGSQIQSSPHVPGGLALLAGETRSDSPRWTPTWGPAPQTAPQQTAPAPTFPGNQAAFFSGPYAPLQYPGYHPYAFMANAAAQQQLGKRKCWVCDSTDHLAADCTDPKRKNHPAYHDAIAKLAQRRKLSDPNARKPLPGQEKDTPLATVVNSPMPSTKVTVPIAPAPAMMAAPYGFPGFPPMSGFHNAFMAGMPSYSPFDMHMSMPNSVYGANWESLAAHDLDQGARSVSTPAPNPAPETTGDDTQLALMTIPSLVSDGVRIKETPGSIAEKSNAAARALGFGDVVDSYNIGGD